jgi:hypothetical protein
MLKLYFERPNTIGIFKTKEYNNYSEAESFIESQVERHCDRQWEANESANSNSNNGCIELTHDEESDVLLIHWETV